jgi:predicted transcriptional regulator
VQTELAAGGIRIAYTTVQTMLGRLEAKGQVRREPKGRAHCFAAVATERSVLGSALRGFLERYFDGSAGELATHLVERGLRRAELDRLEATIAASRRGRRSGRR